MSKELMWGILLIVVAFLMLKNPRCNRGCKTVAEHIFSHGADDVLAAILA